MMAKADPFSAHVAKVAKQADRKALGKALGILMVKRAKRVVACDRAIAQQAQRYRLPDSLKPQRRSPRRLGRFRSYTVTAKPDVSRLGTFRHYMLSTIRKHTNTQDANAEHAACDNPEWAKNKLSFTWAADNGYITFN